MSIMSAYDLPHPDDPEGRSIREVNRAKQHGIPHGTLVHVRYERWYGDGACDRVEARLFVIKRGRDCDGTPVYWLARESMGEGELDKIRNPLLRVANGLVGAFTEDRLTPIEITPALLRGEGALSWEHNEPALVDGDGI